MLLFSYLFSAILRVALLSSCTFWACLLFGIFILSHGITSISVKQLYSVAFVTQLKLFIKKEIV